MSISKNKIKMLLRLGTFLFPEATGIESRCHRSGCNPEHLLESGQPQYNLFVRELDFSAFGGILVTRTEMVREFQFPNQQRW